MRNSSPVSYTHLIIAVALMIGTLLVIRAIVAKKHTGIFQEMANAGKQIFCGKNSAGRFTAAGHTY